MIVSHSGIELAGRCIVRVEQKNGKYKSSIENISKKNK